MSRKSAAWQRQVAEGASKVRSFAGPFSTVARGLDANASSFMFKSCIGPFILYLNTSIVPKVLAYQVMQDLCHKQ